MKILITGGAGFIGSNVADAYVAAGHDVVIVDNLSTGSLANLNPQAKFYRLDIADPELSAIFAAEMPDIVNHHAAQASVPLSISDPLNDAATNVLGVINLLQNCIKYHVNKVIYISSGGAIYGEAEEYPTTETYPPNPLSFYAIHKLVGENYLHFYHHQYGLNYTVLRYANVYGPRQMAAKESGVISLFISQMLAGQVPTINRYADEPDGMLRDYVFVQDVVQANLKALSHGSGEAINIGTDVETSTLELFREIEAQLQTGFKPGFGEPRLGDLHRSRIANHKAKALLAWEPYYSLKEGLALTIEYFKLKKEEA
ncbi:MAG: NAD-dependent epimerase/dehydratase family protein [Candidatus Cloacimonetes bacterium]|nr:NAD-dependent epimerase/dehydratase family protein [Candidatus Cloacimonadota bacterium]